MADRNFATGDFNDWGLGSTEGFRIPHDIPHDGLQPQQTPIQLPPPQQQASGPLSPPFTSAFHNIPPLEPDFSQILPPLQNQHQNTNPFDPSTSFYPPQRNQYNDLQSIAEQQFALPDLPLQNHPIQPSSLPHQPSQHSAEYPSSTSLPMEPRPPPAALLQPLPVQVPSNNLHSTDWTVSQPLQALHSSQSNDPFHWQLPSHSHSNNPHQVPPQSFSNNPPQIPPIKQSAPQQILDLTYGPEGYPILVEAAVKSVVECVLNSADPHKTLRDITDYMQRAVGGKLDNRAFHEAVNRLHGQRTPGGRSRANSDGRKSSGGISKQQRDRRGTIGRRGTNGAGAGGMAA